MKEEYKFIECDTCRAKPGSPPLCYGCLHNRDIIGKLSEIVCEGYKFEPTTIEQLKKCNICGKPFEPVIEKGKKSTYTFQSTCEHFKTKNGKKLHLSIG